MITLIYKYFRNTIDQERENICLIVEYFQFRVLYLRPNVN